jgi:hypothetical protein
MKKVELEGKASTIHATSRLRRPACFARERVNVTSRFRIRLSLHTPDYT